MRAAPIALSVASLMLAATLTSAQPQPQTQPPRPQPQDPTPVPDPKPPLTKPQPKPDEPSGSGRLGGNGEITVSGCLQRGEEAPGEGKSEGKLMGGYILREATTTKPATSSTSDARSPQAEPASKGSKEYRIVAAKDSVKLAEHVGHQVQVTGRLTLEEPAPSRGTTDSGVSASQPSGSTGVSTPTAGAVPAGGPLVTLKATSLEMIASSCSAPAS
jgi:hypothetical protein